MFVILLTYMELDAHREEMFGPFPIREDLSHQDEMLKWMRRREVTHGTYLTATVYIVTPVDLSAEGEGEEARELPL